MTAESTESLALVNNSPRGTRGAGQLGNAETVSWSMYSRSQSNLLCILQTLPWIHVVLSLEIKFLLDDLNVWVKLEREKSKRRMKSD